VVLGGVARRPEEGWVPCLHWLIERLARRHEVHVFSVYGARRPDQYRFFGATVHHAGARPRRLRTLAAIMAEHRRAPFALLHAFWLLPQAVIAACAGKLLGLPVLAHVAGGELVALPDIAYGGLLTWRGRVWVRLALSGASRITAASTPIIDILRARGYAAEQVQLGVDLQRWPVATPRARQRGTPARLVHVATLNRVKDQTTLLHATRRLADHGVDFRLDIAGGDTLDGAVEALARDLRLGDRVRFHGYLRHEQLYQLVKGADVHLLSSRHEAGELATLEAAVAGVPTVGTTVGYVAEWAPEAAVAAPPRHADALAEAVMALLLDDRRRLALAGEAQRRALAHDADWTARRFESLYAELASAATRKGRDR